MSLSTFLVLVASRCKWVMLVLLLLASRCVCLVLFIAASRCVCLSTSLVLVASRGMSLIYLALYIFLHWINIIMYIFIMVLGTGVDPHMRFWTITV